ncbi:MAG: 2Fe-2S iron-sulfur cluster-binding protein [Alphaproteobacteria bacterium]
MNGTGQTTDLRITASTVEAEDVKTFELRAIDGATLPAFSAGAHIDLHLPNGLVRSYSLLNCQDERDRYVIAVNRDAASRGGSTYIHNSVRIGDMLKVATPRNNFPLNETAAQSVFIAGGIGITPILSMVQRLEKLGRAWTLYYCSRTRQSAAFLNRLRTIAGGASDRLRLVFDREPGGKMLNIDKVVTAADRKAHLYCCGPLPMLTAFEKATEALMPEQVHVEYFMRTAPPAVSGGFTVTLAKSHKTVTVKPGQTILDAVLKAGVPAEYSCREGICAVCETKILDGTPDHRDLVLSKSERAANKSMMICCSGCKGDRLVLDL